MVELAFHAVILDDSSLLASQVALFNTLSIEYMLTFRISIALTAFVENSIGHSQKNKFQRFPFYFFYLYFS